MKGKFVNAGGMTLLCALSVSCHSQPDEEKNVTKHNPQTTKRVAANKSKPLSTLNKTHQDKLKVVCEDKDKDENGNCIIPNHTQPKKPPTK